MAKRCTARISFSPLTPVDSNLYIYIVFTIIDGIFLICKVCLCTLISNGSFTSSTAVCLIYPEDLSNVTYVLDTVLSFFSGETSSLYYISIDILSSVIFWVVLRRMVFISRRFGPVSVPKRRLLNTIRRITTQKITLDIQNTAKAWNQVDILFIFMYLYYYSFFCLPS
jgi:hypothetical protein